MILLIRHFPFDFINSAVARYGFENTHLNFSGAVVVVALFQATVVAVCPEAFMVGTWVGGFVRVDVELGAVQDHNFFPPVAGGVCDVEAVCFLW